MMLLRRLLLRHLGGSTLLRLLLRGRLLLRRLGGSALLRLLLRGRLLLRRLGGSVLLRLLLGGRLLLRRLRGRVLVRLLLGGRLVRRRLGGRGLVRLLLRNGLLVCRFGGSTLLHGALPFLLLHRPLLGSGISLGQGRRALYMQRMTGFDRTPRNRAGMLRRRRCLAIRRNGGRRNGSRRCYGGLLRHRWRCATTVRPRSQMREIGRPRRAAMQTHYRLRWYCRDCCLSWYRRRCRGW